MDETFNHFDWSSWCETQIMREEKWCLIGLLNAAWCNGLREKWERIYRWREGEKCADAYYYSRIRKSRAAAAACEIWRREKIQKFHHLTQKKARRSELSGGVHFGHWGKYDDAEIQLPAYKGSFVDKHIKMSWVHFLPVNNNHLHLSKPDKRKVVLPTHLLIIIQKSKCAYVGPFTCFATI